MLRKITCLLFFAALFSAFAGFRERFYASQPPTNHSGAPDGFGICADCHNNLNSGGGSVVFNGLPSHFQPGATYPFSVTISHPAARERWGFQINARNANGEHAGSFSTTHPNAALGGSAAELSHNNAVFSSGTSYTYNNLFWTAPATPGTNDNQVTFYLAGNAANGDNNSTGDFIYTNTALLTLPVTLKDFVAGTEGEKVILHWTAASESNSKDYVIERSSNDITFQPIGRIAASGQSQVEQKYSFTDNAVPHFNQPVYYRLKMVDLDNSVRYSKTVMVVVRRASRLVEALFPNPARDHIILTLRTRVTGNADIMLSDAAGKTISRKSLILTEGKTVYRLSLNGLQQGNYFIQVQTSSQRDTQPFFKR